MKPCAICSKKGSLEHILIFCAVAQIAWGTLGKYFNWMYSVIPRIDTDLIFLGLVNDSSLDKNQRKHLANLAGTTI